MQLASKQNGALRTLRHIASMNINLPEYIEVCSICNGKGSYEQLYTAGCGGGYFSHDGPCDYCSSVGFRYKHTGDPIGGSVIAQIIAMNHKLLESSVL